MKSNILIVDDVQMNRELLEYILEGEYNIYQAEDGKQAVEMLEKEDVLFHLVLLDIHMPKMDGYEVLQYMQGRTKFANLPIIIISNESADAAVLNAYELGATDVIRRPFSAKIVLNRVRKVLELSEYNFKDFLTGGLNWEGFIRQAAITLKNRDDQAEYAMLFVNINNLRAVKEIFGFDMGENLLRDFYTILEDSLLKPLAMALIEQNKFICLIKRENLDFDVLTDLMKRSVPCMGIQVNLYGTSGIYYIDDFSLPIASMVDRAKLAQQHIVDSYTKPYNEYSQSLKQNYIDQAEVLADFKQAIDNEEFELYCQPLISASDGKVVSGEVLVRWVHPQKGMIMPGIFLPVLEKNGYISKLEAYIIDKVYDRLKVRHKEGKINIPLSVNLSWMDFYDKDLMHCILSHMEDKTLPKGVVRYEITETSIAALEQNPTDVLEKFQSYGSKVLLDDFGTGYSSYGVLRNYNFDVLKMDMSFVRQIETSSKNRSIVRSIIDMGHQLGMEVVAEGVETQEQLQFLKDSGCDYIQGYIFSRPLPEKEFFVLIEKMQKEGKIAGGYN